MSVTHPLIKALKESTRELLLWSLGGDTKQDIDDTCATLASLCADLEAILLRGLLPRKTLFGTQHPEPWHWMEELAERPSLPYSFQSAMTLARKSTKVTTARGRLRLAIRACLKNGCLHVPIQTLVQTGDQEVAYRAGSVLGDAILVEIFVSVLLQLSRLPFKLALANARFLDTTWQLPTTAQLELLPCAAIGLSLDFVGNLAVVVAVAPGSVAEDTEVIDVGDVVDEINGVVIGTKTRGCFKDIMRRGAKQPVVVSIVKLFPDDGDAFGPLDSIISTSQVAQVVEKAVMIRRHAKEAVTRSDEKAVTCPKSSEDKRARLGLEAFFEGVASTGRLGNVGCIEAALRQVARHTQSCQGLEHEVRRRVTFECREVGVRVVDAETSELLLSHTYMEISACGRSPRWPLRFAYIAGDDSPNCSKANSFTCYVFVGNNTKEVEALLRSIGQGFTRTHYAV